MTPKASRLMLSAGATAIFLTALPFGAHAESHFSISAKLAERKLIATDVQTCAQVESHLGQLFLINVDNFFSGMRATNLPVSEEYYRVVKDLNIGGILPHFRNLDYLDARASISRFKRSSQLPLLVAADYVGKMDDVREVKSMFAEKQYFGLGYFGGVLQEMVPQFSKACVDLRFDIEASLHQLMGINLALGPTIDNQLASDVVPLANRLIAKFAESGVSTVVKHFPYAPTDFDLEKISKDIMLSRREIEGKIEPFAQLAPSADFAMSTHVFDSKIDPDNMVTFSKTWIQILREQIGFKGILITDGMFMLSRYPKSVSSMQAQWPRDLFDRRYYDDQTVFIARSILAGHDMVLVEGTAGDTRKQFRNLVYLACQNNPISKNLRARILMSAAKVESYKATNSARLSRDIQRDRSVVEGLLEIKGLIRDDMYGQCENGRSRLNAILSR